jgi:hypothetical protein
MDAQPGAWPDNRQPIIRFYPRFDKTRRTGSAMTAPSGDHSAPAQPHLKLLRLQLFPLPCNLHLSAEIGGIG